jgi:hypothetical protein
LVIQNIEYRIEKGMMVETKTIASTVLEHRSPAVVEHSQCKFEYTSAAGGSGNTLLSSLPSIKIPVVPPTMVGVCRLLQVYYTLKVPVPTISFI